MMRQQVSNAHTEFCDNKKPVKLLAFLKRNNSTGFKWYEPVLVAACEPLWQKNYQREGADTFPFSWLTETRFTIKAIEEEF